MSDTVWQVVEDVRPIKVYKHNYYNDINDQLSTPLAKAATDDGISRCVVFIIIISVIIITITVTVIIIIVVIVVIIISIVIVIYL